MRNVKNPPHGTGAKLVSKELQNDGAGEDYARNNDLNVSNLEHSPSSIPDYVQPQIETVSSLSVTECSVQRENPRARGAWRCRESWLGDAGSAD